MQWIKYIIPTLCIVMEKIKERFRSISCDCVMWYQHRHIRPLNRARAKNLNQDWIHSAASSKGAGLPFHISALFFDIYEPKLSANELAFPPRPPSQHRQTHTLKHTVQYISSVWYQHISTYQTVHFFNIYDIKASGMPISTISADWTYLDDLCQMLIWNIKIMILIVVWPVRWVLSKSLTDVWVIQKLHDPHFSEELRKHNKERGF